MITSVSALGSGKYEERVTCDPKAGRISSNTALGWGGKGPLVTISASHEQMSSRPRENAGTCKPSSESGDLILWVPWPAFDI